MATTEEQRVNATEEQRVKDTAWNALCFTGALIGIFILGAVCVSLIIVALNIIWKTLQAWPF
jgi:hypothetical protein